MSDITALPPLSIDTVLLNREYVIWKCNAVLCLNDLYVCLVYDEIQAGLCLSSLSLVAVEEPQSQHHDHIG